MNNAISSNPHHAPLKRKRRKRSLFGLMRALISFLLMYAILFAAYYTLFFFLPVAFISAQDTDTVSAADIIIGEERPIDGSSLVFNSVSYISSDILQKLADISVSGDGKTVSLTLNQSNEIASFRIGTESAVVNGCSVSMSSASFMEGSSLYLPLDFCEGIISGLVFTYNEDKTQCTLSVSDGAILSYKLKGAIPETALVESAMYSESAIKFTSSLADYEKYMNPGTTQDYLLLVNKTHFLKETYIPENLIDITNTRTDGRAPQKMVEYAAKALEAFFTEMKAKGYTDVSVTSGYRTFAYQNQLFTSYTNSEMEKDDSLTEEAAQAIVETYSARPGTSEHQSGLCCDMHNLSSASKAFANTEAAKWMAENAHFFGFILRFPADKTAATGYDYEPWHFRYVGRYHATRIYNEGLCLEEYLAKYYPDLQ